MMRLAGTDVVMLEFSDKPLPMFDQQMVSKLIDSLNKQGIRIEFNRAPQRIEINGDGLYKVYAEKRNELGKPVEYETEMVLNTGLNEKPEC